MSWGLALVFYFPFYNFHFEKRLTQARDRKLQVSFMAYRLFTTTKKELNIPIVLLCGLNPISFTKQAAWQRWATNGVMWAGKLLPWIPRLFRSITTAVKLDLVILRSCDHKIKLLSWSTQMIHQSRATRNVLWIKVIKTAASKIKILLSLETWQTHPRILMKVKLKHRSKIVDFECGWAWN